MLRSFLLIALNLVVVAACLLLQVRYGWWMLLPGAAVIGLIALLNPPRDSLWQQRASRGLCTKCGYDLRASIIRCPECGHSMED